MTIYSGGLYANDSLHWNVYESLITTYANDFKYGHLCMMLRRNFHIFRNNLKNRNDKYSRDSLERLSSILESENIDLDQSYEMAQRFLPLKFPNKKLITYESFKKFSMFRNMETETETGKKRNGFKSEI